MTRHYYFNTYILLHNVSMRNVQDLKALCKNLFTEEQQKLRSTKYWTRCEVDYFTIPDPYALKSILHFVIHDIPTAGDAKILEQKLRRICQEEGMKRCIKDIDIRYAPMNSKKKRGR